MKKNISFFTAVLLFFCIFSLFADVKENIAEIEKLYRNGNYKQSALLAENVLRKLKKNSHGDLAGIFYDYGKKSYARLGEYEKQFSLQQFVMEHFPENLSVLEKLDNDFSSGYILEGKVVRGYPRGIRAEIINLKEYDRIRLLQHIYKVKKKFDKETSVVKGRYYSLLAKFLQRESGESWKLQNLTSLKEPPRYDKKFSGSYSPPPVDKNNEPLLYKVPSSFENGANDGERLRYCWEMMQKGIESSFKWIQGAGRQRAYYSQAE